MENRHFTQLAEDIKSWGLDLGFQQVGISHIDLDEAGKHLNGWLEKQYHGDMEYMKRHGSKRYRPAELMDGTVSIIAVRLNYMIDGLTSYDELLLQPKKAAISRYALGRDYHKVLRQKLKKLAEKIAAEIGDFGYRVFTDSAPIMEKAIAEQAGLGWIGKNTLLLNNKAGSHFFLGEIYTDLPLPADQPEKFHCGSCRKCLDVCPTQAIVAPFVLDARRCISYLTIENQGSIPVQFRAAMGNRIYGCDDCQVVCPWNRFTKFSEEPDFLPRHQLDEPTLLELFAWSESEFLQKMEGSPIRRIGYLAWQRNIAVALGNALRESLNGRAAIVDALKQKQQQTESDMLQEHIFWALQQAKQKPIGRSAINRPPNRRKARPRPPSIALRQQSYSEIK